MNQIVNLRKASGLASARNLSMGHMDGLWRGFQGGQGTLSDTGRPEVLSSPPPE